MENVLQKFQKVFSRNDFPNVYYTSQNVFFGINFLNCIPKRNLWSFYPFDGVQEELCRVAGRNTPAVKLSLISGVVGRSGNGPNE